jgi:hypothetical protein
LVRALSRWENESFGQDAGWKKRADLIEDEGRILQCLGAAVMTRWNALPPTVQREIFVTAAWHHEPLALPKLKEQIARFLHSNKDL